jgi:hypothetical protein
VSALPNRAPRLAGALAAGAAVAGAAAALACGPYFPNRILTGRRSAILSAPEADFAEEIKRFQPSLKPGLKAVPPKGEDYARQTFEAAAADLKAALAKSEMGERQRDVLEANYAVLRRSVAAAPRDLAVPKSLPKEFALYLRGAAAWRRGEEDEARKHWKALLGLPAEERRWRSTWAAFMLGKSWTESAFPDRAAPWFQKVRELQAAGFKDTLGLAASSFGWQARAALNAEDPVDAAALYLKQHAAGDPTALPSLQTAADEILHAPEADQVRAARDRAARQVVTAYLISRAGPYRERPGREKALAWLKAAGKAGVRRLESADRLALAAYQAAEMKTAEEWLERADPNAPLTLWLRAKLLLREGNVDAAAGLLARTVRAFPRAEVWSDPRYWAGYYEGSGLKARDQVRGELAVLRLGRRQYVESLDLLVRGGFWGDAAYVAERVLTPEELVRYVNRNWPEPKPRGEDDYGFRPEEEIRYVLARRLARLRRFSEARPYYPPKMRPVLDAYRRALAHGRDERRAKHERAAALWKAARLARYQGMELIGTEVEPDWALHSGSFSRRAASRTRTGPKTEKLLRASSDEVRRLRMHRVFPEKRFHYRYTAADLAWEAAALMPAGKEATARVLCEAGTWLKARDPQEADRFYKALVRWCPNTELGREAARLRWFPAFKPAARQQ